ncbi:hypothetical protein BDR07DRAFT_1423248 [Suillus spraguei]|nr:hypothetical protein BDR07DRAFT_1423248 [Suillus spraguei]
MNRQYALNFSMIFLLCAALFYAPFVCASLSGLNDTCQCNHTPVASDTLSYDTRTLWDILSSCGLTLFACTWTAVHPDIPYMDQRVMAITWRRLVLMVVVLIAPEFMTFWAAEQFFEAREVAKNFNDLMGIAQCTWHQAILSKLAVALLGDIPTSDRSSSADALTGWTLAHGFFADMGGFVLYVDGEPWATLTPKELLEFVREGSVEMPVITKADIEDRSKGDVLSKCVAILQLVWFFIQLIARYAQKLPVTPLEIDTLGVAALACISYGLWLKKPKDVGRPYIVHWNSEATAPSPNTRFEDKYYSMSRLGIRRLSKVNPLVIWTDGCIRPSDVTIDDWASYMTITIPGVSGVVFGAIHCLGWNFLFPRHTEQILWRAASTGMACSIMVPFIVYVMLLLSGYLEPIWDKVPKCLKWTWNKVSTCLEWIWYKVSTCLEWIWDKVLKWTWYKISDDLQHNIKLFVGGLYVLFYLFSRVTIIVLMFLSLRSLPPGAYDTVVWTKFIPHLNT